MLEKILENYKNAINSIQIFIQRMTQINNNVETMYIIKIQSSIKDIENVIKTIEHLKKTEDISYEFVNISHFFLLIKYYKNIIKYLENTINKAENVEMFLSQTFIDETYSFYEKMIVILKKYELDNKSIIDSRINEICVREIEKLNQIYSTVDIKKEDGELIKYIKNLQMNYRKNMFAIELYYNLLEKILEKTTEWFPQDNQINFTILDMVEQDKNYLVHQYEYKETPKIDLNPYYKNFSLIPLTKYMYINEIAKYIKVEEEVKELKELIKILESKKYGIILINQQMANPIIYDITSLINPIESKEYEQKNKSAFGVNKEIIERYKTIQKLFHKNKWNFKTEIYNQDAEFFVILECASAGLYRVMSNLSPSYNKYYNRATSIKNLLDFVLNKKIHSTRAGIINKIELIKGLPKIFNPIRIDAEKIKVNSTISDPKYLRNEIYISLNNYFLNLLDKKYQDGKKIKDTYTYGVIIHSEEFLHIFSSVITKEFYEYLYRNRDEHERNNISVNEILASFIRTLYIYQRDFTKEIHDYFKNNSFKFVNNVDNSFQLKIHFTNMIDYVLNKIINANSNIYQLILYKINLLKNTFI